MLSGDWKALCRGTWDIAESSGALWGRGSECLAKKLTHEGYPRLVPGKGFGGDVGSAQSPLDHPLPRRVPEWA